MLEELLSLNIFGFFLIFSRVGTAISVMPGFSASFFSARLRLGLALAICFVLTPILIAGLPVRPQAIPALALLILGEILIGAFIGSIGRIAISALQTAGTVIAYVSSMANALIQDPIAEQQSSTIASFLLTMGIVMVFVTDLHHDMLKAVIASYSLFPPGEPPPVGDFAENMGRRVADSFALGLRMAAPVVIVGLTYYIGLGLLGRLMPTLQVFFFGMPFQIGAQIWVLMVTLSGIMMVFLRNYGNVYQSFMLP
ncbi:MAG: flagellar biosynthetic protein FliR [Proteobacteria bacterium]|nr:flagellar biosynthetic protein FliR [Pseudomonadota bacterium]MDA1023339.1 flagellar biosynthetic protein FliR [Pseudomonadota bacterium]